MSKIKDIVAKINEFEDQKKEKYRELSYVEEALSELDTRLYELHNELEKEHERVNGQGN